MPKHAQQLPPSKDAPISRQQHVEVAGAHPRTLPGSYIHLLPQPLSAYDDNPVLNEAGAAFILGVSQDLLKKWRQRKLGPDYIQYGKNGPVRYELHALLQFRDRHTIRNGS